MKRAFSLIVLLFFLTACDDSLHVDMQEEFRTHPGATLTLTDGTKIPGFKTDFCTDVLCYEASEVDFLGLTYTPYINGEDLVFKVDGNNEIRTISISTLNEIGEKTHRELPYTEQTDGTFLIEEAFPDDEKKFTLKISVDFETEGNGDYLFPIELK